MAQAQPVTESCGTCQFFVATKGARTGECRRYAPHPVKWVVARDGNIGPPDTNFNWPFVGDDDWCGEWGLKKVA